MSVVDRPETTFDGPSHIYTLEGDGPDVLGVSTVAKIGSAEDTWGIASAWGFRIGYEGAFDLATAEGQLQPFDVAFRTKEGEQTVNVGSRDEMRAALKGRGLTPWGKRDKAADRGSWVHDLLEAFGQDRELPNMAEFEAKYGGEAARHARSLFAAIAFLRPEFVATEVQIASREHRFAGRYDIRCRIEARRLVSLLEPPLCPVFRTDPQAVRLRELAVQGKTALGLGDLKTSKGIYPEQHFVQLEGYEGGGVEMGFPATDFRFVINTNEDGSFEPTNIGVSWAVYDDFVAYLGALRAIRRIKTLDPEKIAEREFEQRLLALLPGYSRDIAKLVDSDAKTVGGIYGKLRKRGLVKQERGCWMAA